MGTLIRGEQVRGHLETMLLALLEEQDAHGFELVKRLEQQGSGALTLREGTIYPVLYRLEKSRLVKARWEDSASSRRGPRRRIYSLTKKGHKQLAAGRESWSTFVQVVGGIMGAPA